MPARARLPPRAAIKRVFKSARSRDLIKAAAERSRVALAPVAGLSPRRRKKSGAPGRERDGESGSVTIFFWTPTPGAQPLPEKLIAFLFPGESAALSSPAGKSIARERPIRGFVPMANYPPTDLFGLARAPFSAAIRARLRIILGRLTLGRGRAALGS